MAPRAAPATHGNGCLSLGGEKTSGKVRVNGTKGASPTSEHRLIGAACGEWIAQEKTTD
jgi:hypothetical protein